MKPPSRISFPYLYSSSVSSQTLYANSVPACLPVSHAYPDCCCFALIFVYVMASHWLWLPQAAQCQGWCVWMSLESSFLKRCRLIVTAVISMWEVNMAARISLLAVTALKHRKWAVIEDCRNWLQGARTKSCFLQRSVCTGRNRDTCLMRSSAIYYSMCGCTIKILLRQFQFFFYMNCHLNQHHYHQIPISAIEKEMHSESTHLRQGPTVPSVSWETWKLNRITINSKCNYGPSLGKNRTFRKCHFFHIL